MLWSAVVFVFCVILLEKLCNGVLMLLLYCVLFFHFRVRTNFETHPSGKMSWKTSLGNDSMKPDWVIYCTLDNFSKPVATIVLPKSTLFLGYFC